MRKSLKLMFVIGALTVSYNSFAVPVVIPTVTNTSGPTTFLGPTFRGTYAGWLTSNSAFSVLGEAAPRNYRLSLTGGWAISPTQRIKFSGEYLYQKMNFSFITEHNSRWVQQGAIGAEYVLDFGNTYVRAFELSGFLSHAPSKNLSAVLGSTTANFITTNWINHRRIAGSNAGGASGGLDFSFWMDSLIGFDLNYDDVNYDTKYAGSDNISGLGGTIRLEQRLGEHARIYALASQRKPFNNYKGTVSWDNFIYHGRWSTGLFGEYTSGKHNLPNSYNIGLSLNYFADCLNAVPMNLKDEVIDVKNEGMVASANDPNFLNWVSDPAVYMPQVLAKTDQNVQALCPLGGVFSYGILSDQFVLGPGASVTFATAQLFVGNELTYSVQFTPALSFGDSITINSTTGEITARVGTVFPPAHDTTYVVTVTATNSCGSATSRPFLIRLDF